MRCPCCGGEMLVNEELEKIVIYKYGLSNNKLKAEEKLWSDTQVVEHYLLDVQVVVWLVPNQKVAVLALINSNKLRSSQFRVSDSLL